MPTLQKEKITIVEYRPELAAKIAKMWNESRDGWGGDSAVMEAEDVLREQENSENLHTFIALVGDEVVGYCGLKENFEDEGSLYISLLNVRTDYHNRKIGKALVLKAVERTIQLGWPRLDLHTWPGNTKAVPLYKKCGFFWEERDDTTHLMNFIPTVVQTEAVQPFFATADWYDDSVRPIEVKPDGRKQNGFDFFEYRWEKDGRSLRMEFERSGRGLRLIETDDYLIEATVENNALVFGRDYEIAYRIVNKTGQPLQVALSGCNNKNIIYSFSETVDVTDDITVCGTFHVGAVEEEPHQWKTHPAVVTELCINGKKVLFKLGIAPKFPLQMKGQQPLSLCHQGEGVFYLDLENNALEETTFHFTLPHRSFIQLAQTDFSVTLAGQEKLSLPVSFALTGFGVYEQKIEVQVSPSDNEAYVFEKKIAVPFPGFGARFLYEDGEYYYLYNGPYRVTMNKDNGFAFPAHGESHDVSTFFLPPKLGKPYSDEIEKQRPVTVTFSENGTAAVMRATYHAKRFTGLHLTAVVTLFAEGLVERYVELYNDGDEERREAVYVRDPFYHDLYDGVIPYDGNIVVINANDGDDADYWNFDKLSENWLFAQKTGRPCGVCWPASSRVLIQDWFLALDSYVGKIGAKETVTTPPVTISIGAFPTWEAFRAFAVQQVGNGDTAFRSDDDFHGDAHRSAPSLSGSEYATADEHVHMSIQPVEPLALSANAGNPFLRAGQTDYALNVDGKKREFFQGTIAVEQVNCDERITCTEKANTGRKADCGEWTADKERMVGDGDEQLVQSFREADECRAAHFTLPAPETCARLAVTTDFSAKKETLRRVMFRQGKEPIRVERFEADGYENYCVDNGVIALKAAPAFYPSVYSLRYNGREWFDHTYPTLRPKHWWNPWMGGLRTALKQLTPHSQLKEERRAEFVTREDSFGNAWQGIKLTVQLSAHKRYKGLTYAQYAMLLPGIPLVAMWVEFEQRTGTFLSSDVHTLLSIKSSDDYAAMRIATSARDDSTAYYLNGSRVLLDRSHVLLSANTHTDVLHLIDPRVTPHNRVYLNEEVCEMTFMRRVRAADGSVQRLQPSFLLLSDRVFNEEELRDLKRLRFDE